MKLLSLNSLIVILSILALSTTAIGTTPAQAATHFQTDSGAQAGGTPITDGELQAQAVVVAQVNVNTTIGTYKDFPLLTFKNETNITGLDFSSFYYTFADSPTIENVRYSATGGTCSQSDRTIRCNGRITAFQVSYTYYQDADVSDGTMSIVESFSSSGFSFNGVFATSYQSGLFKYKTSTINTEVLSKKSIRWQTSSTTTYEANTITFDLRCVLIKYKASNFRGPVVVANVDFITNLNLINQAAINSNVQVLISGSTGATFRIDGAYVPGAVVSPAKKSTHLVGHAIDMNVRYGPGYSQTCNSTCLKSAKNRPQPVTDFITAVKAAGLRWGGDFSVKDPVHFDDNYYLASPTKYAEQFKLAQSNPSCRLGFSLNP